MKTLLVLVLLLTGCANFSEYRQGCYDTLDALISDDALMPVNQRAELENEKNKACNDLMERRERRSRREFWSPPNPYRPPYHIHEDGDF